MSVDGLTGLNILIVSPNSWGDMRVSKHHYAVALARRGNRVFFLNPPEAHAKARFRLLDVEGVEGLSIITYRPFVPFIIRFRFRRLFDLVAAAHVRWLTKKLNRPIDVVWCFDANLYSDLGWFDAPLKIFHPVDQISLPYQTRVAASANVVVSVSDEILRNTRQYGTPRLRVEHGLAPEFVALAERRLSETTYRQHVPLRVGYVGNLLMPYIDCELMLRIIASHQDVEFHLWGPRSNSESNVGSDSIAEGMAFIRALAALPNVTLHGAVEPAVLATQIGDMDILLLCYSVARDPNRGCNSHKILEYLSTGRVIVSNHVSDYADKPELIEMMPSTGDSDMMKLFDGVTGRITDLNSQQKRRARLEFALHNTYSNQIDRIASFVADVTSASERPDAPALSSTR